MKTVLTTLSLLMFAGTASAQLYSDFNPRSQVPYPFGYNAPFRDYGSNNRPFGYRSPYQGGFDGYGTYYGSSRPQSNLPYYSPYGYPSQAYPSYQPNLNPYYGGYYRTPRPYYRR